MFNPYRKNSGEAPANCGAPLKVSCGKGYLIREQQCPYPNSAERDAADVKDGEIWECHYCTQRWTFNRFDAVWVKSKVP